MATQTIKINRAPVMTLWGAVVAERLGYDQEAALTLGKTVAGLNAQAKGQRLGIYEPAEEKEEPAEKERRPNAGELVWVELLGRQVPAVQTEHGLRALSKDQPVHPRSVQRYLEKKFGAELATVQEALKELAASYGPEELSRRAYALYEKFRPQVPEGQRGWGAAGELSLERIRTLKAK